MESQGLGLSGVYGLGFRIPVHGFEGSVLFYLRFAASGRRSWGINVHSVGA